MAVSSFYDFSFEELDAAGALELPMPHLGDLRTIHPIFQRENFPHVTDLEYAAIRPSLRLCSAYLAESSEMQIFWQTVLFGSRHPIPNTPGWHVLLPPFPPFTRAQYRAFDVVLTQMPSMFAFLFGDCHKNSLGIESWGQTNGWDRVAADPSFPRPVGVHGLSSIIKLRSKFLEEAVATQTYLASLPANATPDAATLCRILRQQWFFATTMVHELAHGFNNARVQHPAEPEPFFEPHRCAEVGFAWEQSMHGGVISPVHKSTGCDCGLFFNAWPPGGPPDEVVGPWAPTTGNGWTRWASRMLFFIFYFALGCMTELWDEANEDGVIGRQWNTEYVVPMRHIQKLHTRHFWEVEVRRFGLAALKIPKTLGLRAGDSTRAARLAAGPDGGSVSGGSSRDWVPNREGRIWRR